MGPYEVVRVLGDGAFGRTLEARHRLLGTRACLKVSHRSENEDLLLREARLLWDLHHPGLPTLRDVFFGPAGELVLAMRFVEGAALEAAAPLDPATALRVLGRLLEALRVLHHRGIVHNDIKPANIILEPDRHGVVLVDFGASSWRPGSRSTAPGYTPFFVAPELAAGQPPTPESDLYSLGLTMLHVLGGDVESRRLPAGVPEELLALLVSLSRREPERRATWERADPLARVRALLRSG